MDFEPGWAIVAGLIGGGVLTLLSYMGKYMMPQHMKMDMLQMLGTMMLPAGAMAYGLGLMMHASASAAFGLVYAGLFDALELEATAAWGLLFGLVHWMVAGMAMGMMPIMHPRIRSGQMSAPGVLVLSYPAMTAAGFLMLHLVYGVVVGGLYATLT